MLFYLGEVLDALLELECLDILEDTKPKVDVYIKKKEAGDLVAMSNFANCENFFSIIKTLAVALGNQDPCRDVHKYANGLKNKKNTEVCKKTYFWKKKFNKWNLLVKCPTWF